MGPEGYGADTRPRSRSRLLVEWPGMIDAANADGTRDTEEPPAPGSCDETDLYVVPIEESIDLHHFRPQEILAVVDAYIEAALEAGFREVRLIHGRGKGVQRANIRRFLERDPRVERFGESPADRGGWGATLAWLRNPDDGSGGSSRD